MPESQEFRPPKAGSSARRYLPRLWKAEPELPTPPIAENEGKKQRAGKVGDPGKRKRSHRQEATPDVSKKGVLLEETPGLDTIEARRTARVIMGSVGTVLVLVLGFVIARRCMLPAVEAERPGTTNLVIEDVRALKARNETEARALYERAREVARSGNTDSAYSLLRRVLQAYPETSAASDALGALGHPKNELPVVLEHRTEPMPEPGPVATASEPRAGTTPPRVEPEPATPPSAAVVGSAMPEVKRPDLQPVSKVAAVPTPVAAVPTPVAEPVPARALPQGFQARSGAGTDPSGWPLEIVGGRDGVMMVLVPGGRFVQGHDGGDPVEAPAHPVTVSTFYIDKHEVTNRQFETFVKETGVRGDRVRALTRDGGTVSLSEDYPVVMVSGKDAKDYADWAGKRIPTEAQWEKAARGTDQRPHPWGNLPAAWTKPRVPQQIDAVMSFPSDLSPYGVYDMAGNAMEWTRDWFDPDLYTLLRGAKVEDPTGPVTRPASLQLTVKGGSKEWLVAAREGVKFDARLPYLGFRCVLPVEGPDSAQQPVAAPPGAAAPNGATGSGKKVVVPF